MMIKAGAPVDDVIGHLKPLLQKEDIIIDGGNANFHDTMRRFDALKDSGLTYIGMGVSGGEEGARHGPSIMVGGKSRPGTAWRKCSLPYQLNTREHLVPPIWAPMALAISSRPSTTALNMATCR